MTPAHLNAVLLVGTLGAEPMLTGRTGKIVTLRVCTDKEWHRIRCTTHAAALVETLQRGDLVRVWGRIQTLAIEKNGEQRYQTSVVAERLELWSEGEWVADEMLERVVRRVQDDAAASVALSLPRLLA